MVRAGCDQKCVDRTDPRDIGAWTNDKCKCWDKFAKIAVGPSTDFAPTDFLENSLEDWVANAEETEEAVANDQHLQQMIAQDMKEEADAENVIELAEAAAAPEAMAAAQDARAAMVAAQAAAQPRYTGAAM